MHQWVPEDRKTFKKRLEDPRLQEIALGVADGGKIPGAMHLWGDRVVDVCGAGTLGSL